MNLFQSKRPPYEYLRKKWVAKNKELSENLVSKHLKTFAAGSLGGLMLLTAPGMATTHNLADQNSIEITSGEDRNRLLVAELIDKVPTDASNLDSSQEQTVSTLLSNRFGIKVL